MSIAPALMLGDTNSSGLYPLPGSSAVGGSARNLQLGARKAPFINSMSLVHWSCRSLWAHKNCETIEFTLKLAHAHDITNLSETRKTNDRQVFLRSKVLIHLELFSSGIDQFKVGLRF